MSNVPPAGADASRDRYDAFHAQFRWNVPEPETFDFETDAVDRAAREADGPAPIRANEAGALRVISSADMSRSTEKAGAMLRRLGLAVRRT